MAKENSKGAGGCPACGHGRPLVFKKYQFWWMEGIDMEVSNLPEDSKIYIHRNFIYVDGAEKSLLQIPMHCIRFINLWEPEWPGKAASRTGQTPCPECHNPRAARFKGFQFFWMAGIDMEVSNLPEDAKLEMHDNFIIVDGSGDSKLLVPMDCLRFINLWQPE